MNGFGEFLYTLRKEKGLTQAELAEMLGVTNKAVSKWETGEAMPETAQLIPLSRIFGVSVDELLDGKRSEKPQESEEQEEGNEKIKDHLFTRGKDDNGEKSLLEKIQGAVCAAVVFAGLTAYFLLGALGGLWQPYWVIIPACALLSGVFGCIFDLFNVNKRNAKTAKGENPYSGPICGIIMLSCIISYLLSGALLNLWHPLWIIIVIGAFACAITAMLAEIINHKRK